MSDVENKKIKIPGQLVPATKDGVVADAEHIVDESTDIGDGKSTHTQQELNAQFAQGGSGPIDPSRLPPIGTENLEDNAVTLVKLKNNSVDSDKLKDGSVTPAKLAQSVVTDVINPAIASGISTKQDNLVSGVNIKTINGESILGEGNLSVGGTPELNTEDLEYNLDGEIQFANRAYNTSTPNGLGYKILRQGDGLTFANQVTEANTIYEIRNDFDLDDEEWQNPIAMPEGCTLRFNGGSLLNGKLTGAVAIENMPNDLFEKISCWDLNITTIRHLSLGDVSDTFDNYSNGIVANRCEQNVKGSAYYYDITGLSKLYMMKFGSNPRVRFCFYKADLSFISYSNWYSSTYAVDIPEGAKYVTFILSFNIGSIPNIETVLKGLAFNFLLCPSTFITPEMRFGSSTIPDSKTIAVGDITQVYISSAGLYILSGSEDNSGICIPYSIFKYYKYLTVTSNDSRATRVHILKEEPKTSRQTVVYSDYYGGNFTVPISVTENIVIPSDARYIFILNKSEGNNNAPVSIKLEKRTIPNSWSATKADLSQRDTNLFSHSFIHWNIGNFSNGVNPRPNSYSGNDVANRYNPRKTAFQNFYNAHRADCHFLLNEYNEKFAIVNGEDIATTSVIFDAAKASQLYPRSSSSGYDMLASFWRDGLRDYIYEIFNSLQGVVNSNGTFEYGTGYSISIYNIGTSQLCVVHLHVPNKITKSQIDSLFSEILTKVAGFSNCVLVGDLNVTNANHLSVLTDAGFSILNPVDANGKAIDITDPGLNTTLDWILYKCSGLTVSDFYVYNEETKYQEIVNGETVDTYLSDHLPVGFTVSRNIQGYATKSKGNYRYNVSNNIPEWCNGEEWFSFNTSGETPTSISNGTDLNDIIEIGQYYCTSASNSSTLLHKPADFVLSGFQMFVRPIAGTGSGRIIQILKGNYTNAPVYTRRSQTDKTFLQGWERMDSYLVGTEGGTAQYVTTNYYYGTTENRNNMTDFISSGHCYFDSTIGKPIWWNSTNWVDYNGTPITWPITYTLTKLSKSNSNQPINGSSYSTTLSPSTGYTHPSTIDVTMGGVTLTAGTDYTYNSSTGAVVILGTGGSGGVTGAITITASGVEQA